MLQKIVDHFKTEWFKYAFETLVVIIGVLIAIAFDDWNAAANNRKIEEQTLANLKIDLVLAKKQLENKIKRVQNNAACDSIILRHIKRRNPRISSDSLLTLIAPRRYPPTYDPDDGTIQDILSTGKIGLIHNVKLRTHISSWGKYINELKEVEQGIITHRTTAVEKFNLNKIPYRNGSRFGRSKLNWDHERVLNSLAFENLHALSFTFYKVLENRYKGHLRDINEMLSLMEEE